MSSTVQSLVFDTDLLSLLPEWYRQVLDYQQMCQTGQAQLEAAATAVQSIADNLFFQTMDESSIALWEQALGIVPDPGAETLAFRQARVISRLSTRPPFTLWFLYQKLDELIGPGQWTVNVDYGNYTLYVESAAQNQSYATEVAFTVGRIKPAHIVYVNTPLIDTGLLLSETIDLTQREWNYRLGAWGLGVLPFASETPQGVIKTANTPSVQAALLSGVANFVSGDVASARINGTVSITDLAKSVSGSTLTITYTVPQSSASEITLCELLDSSGNVLTSSAVYVPVSGSTVLKHTIPVAEGVVTSGS